MTTVTTLALRIAQAGMRYQRVSSSFRAVRFVRRTDHLSMLGPSSPNRAGSTATDSRAARPTAEIAP